MVGMSRENTTCSPSPSTVQPITSCVSLQSVLCDATSESGRRPVAVRPSAPAPTTIAAAAPSPNSEAATRLRLERSPQLEGQAAQLERHEQHARGRIREREVASVGEPCRTARAAQPPDRRAAHVGRAVRVRWRAARPRWASRSRSRRRTRRDRCPPARGGPVSAPSAWRPPRGARRSRHRARSSPRSRGPSGTTRAACTCGVSRSARARTPGAAAVSAVSAPANNSSATARTSAWRRTCGGTAVASATTRGAFVTRPRVRVRSGGASASRRDPEGHRILHGSRLLPG